ncbi:MULTISPECIES: protein-L-isoaspartate(D-aspartate) O-methyltransferase [unclassified Ochrobactrum]|uniref:protein-L-isoaspartate(D-aspartate) O-methyltransferase n=1 Tax=unclassified Ochrobactrum TaxID=239106 RepID=UPI0015FD4511|nr:protein-L-isoaspartate(D-aspartate) O-methyltransferase [Ochrobactrum sp. RH2CCR150]MDH7785285.1 protein-L-isoaspartate(D-aspartate) O-methyltransferase [Ochrobactrum sp. 19YEA23]URQ75811.1 MAG: protein-L-isoaspartate(D-aspartate) O-methyltransferase [Candidatus Ochrobactrum gambitense]WEK15400.1 MAG: protein-L-isoaspartate(D-aspartate) O-methyltransferase [Candidatus Ochrobactrum gambitense]
MRQATSERPRLSDREGFASFVLRMRARGIDDPRLFAAIEATPRQSFLASAWSHLAYSTRTAPLDCGEYIEGIDDQARVLAALKLEPGHRVLEIGTGSGFTAAVMSSLSGRVTTVERYRKLCDHALQQFVSLKRENIMVKHADGRHGMPGGPFDRIILWLACEEVPRHFVELLATHGVLITPIGPGDGEQIMTRISKVGSRFEQENLMVVRYQPFIEGVSSVL